MPARTLKGVHAFEHAQGLKEYIKVAEADRIKFHNAPEKNPESRSKTKSKSISFILYLYLVVK